MVITSWLGVRFQSPGGSGADTALSGRVATVSVATISVATSRVAGRDVPDGSVTARMSAGGVVVDKVAWRCGN